ncbi:NlpC/P60 family protein [Lachnospiraceae bacterium HCP1S3_C3]|nr:NlpC/P60 family protein [Lachnospiraceae bacterium]
MNGRYLKIVAGCFMGAVLASGYGINAQASELSTDMPSAGIAVALQQYYGESETKEADVMALLRPIVGSAEETQPAEEAVSEAETPTEAPTEAATEPETTIYDTIAISHVDNYVNVRSAPSTDAEIVGKIYNDCAATILETDGEWYKIESGNVQGYINSKYFVTGEAAKELALQIGKVFATVNTMTLNVREGQGTDTAILTQLPEGEKYDVDHYGDGWVYLNVDEDVHGWVSQEFVDISVEFDKAVTLEEEQAMLAEQERLRQEAAEKERLAKEAAEKEQARKQAAASQQQASSSQSQSSSQSSQQSAPAASDDTSSYTPSASSSAMQSAVVAYALQFVGNPYVYGGSSLTNGTDCSGFTMAVYAHFGYGLPHSSGSQSGCGYAVSLDSLQPGDLLFYTNDGGSGIGHVALYIGGGQIVHASTPATGIKVSSAFYRTPVAARRIV